MLAVVDLYASSQDIKASKHQIKARSGLHLDAGKSKCHICQTEIINTHLSTCLGK